MAINGRGGREFRNQLSPYLRKRSNAAGERGQEFIRKVKLQDSKRNLLLQLADMVAARIRGKKRSPEPWRSLFPWGGRLGQ